MAKRTDILVARISATITIDGKNRVIHRDRTTAHSDHEIVKGREQMWRPLVVDYATEEAPEEEAPAERPKPKPRKRAAPKKKAAEPKADPEPEAKEKAESE